MEDTTEEQTLKEKQAQALAAQTKNSPADESQEADKPEASQNVGSTQEPTEPTAPSAEEETADDNSATAQEGFQSASSAQNESNNAPQTNDVSVASPEIAQQPEKMIPQSQVDKLVGKARQEGRESAMKALYDKYGVESPDALDELFGNGQRYDGLNDQFSDTQNSLKSLQTENALLRSKVDPSRYDDVKARLAFDNFDVTPENIQQELATHPEWLGNQQAQQGQPNQQIPLTPEMGQQAVQQSQARAQNTPAPEPSVITKLGSQPIAKPAEDEEEKAMHLYGLDK